MVDEKIQAHLFISLKAYEGTIKVIYSTCNECTNYLGVLYGNLDIHKSTTIL